MVLKIFEKSLSKFYFLAVTFEPKTPDGHSKALKTWIIA